MEQEVQGRATSKPIEVDLTTMAHGGTALGRYEGRAIFVPYAIPGETVRVTLVEDKRRFAHARLLEVLAESPDRIPPRCPHFGPGRCGGCQWQHITYPAQLRWKREVLRDQLRRIGGFENPPVLETLPSPSPWGYRNRLTLHALPDGRLGLRRSNSHEIEPIQECAIADPRLMDLLSSLDLELPGLQRLTLRAGAAEDDLMLVFETEDDAPPALEADFPLSCVLLLEDGTPVNLIGRNYVTEIVASYPYRVTAGRFFQVNTGVAETLLRLVSEWLAPDETMTVLDAYCGVGLFTLPLAERAGYVVAVEADPWAVEDLLVNTADQENVEVIEGSVEAVLSDLDVTFDGVVVDPPRAGLDVVVVEALAGMRPDRIVYVSCDPATLARDLKRLTDRGYRLVQVQPVDMFPQTYHIESVSLLTWAGHEA